MTALILSVLALLMSLVDGWYARRALRMVKETAR